MVEEKLRGQMRWTEEVLEGSEEVCREGVCSPMCMSKPCNSSKGIVKGRARVPT